MAVSEPQADQGRRERKRGMTLDHLASTAFRLFEAHGYDAVTMEQIAGEADVAKGTLYNHFPVKEALLARQFHAELAMSVEKMWSSIEAQRTFESRISRLLEASAAWCKSRKPYLPHYLRYRFQNIGGPRSGMDKVLEALVSAGQKSGELRKDLSSEHLASLLQQLYLAALLRWLTQSGLDLGAEMQAIVDVFVHGAMPASRGRKAR